MGHSLSSSRSRRLLVFYIPSVHVFITREVDFAVVIILLLFLLYTRYYTASARVLRPAPPFRARKTLPGVDKPTIFVIRAEPMTLNCDKSFIYFFFVGAAQLRRRASRPIVCHRIEIYNNNNIYMRYKFSSDVPTEERARERSISRCRCNR